MKDLKTLVTGIKPTGTPHLGNYVGAIQPALSLCEEFKNSQQYYFIADYHAITALQKPQELAESIRSVAASWLACGLNPQEVIIYKQSDIPEDLELSWILTCFTAKGLMNRAHSYKAQTDLNEGKKDTDAGIMMGLYSYPILMTADIAIMGGEGVPVGSDQIQHLEMARDIIKKFNHFYKEEILEIPKAIVRDKSATLPGLDGQKMSKSYQNTIPLFLESKALRKKVMKIKTDSTLPGEPKQTDGSCIFQIYQCFATEDEQQSLAKKYESGISWGAAKEILFEKIDSHFKAQKQVYDDLMSSPQKIDDILADGAMRARKRSQQVLTHVKKTIGLMS